MHEKSKNNEKFLDENKILKAEIDTLRKDNESLRATTKVINEKNTHQQIKYLQLVMKYEEMTTLVAKPKTKKTAMGNFKCKHCEKHFLNKVQLEEHQKLHCNICGEIFQSIPQLKKHENNSGHY